MGRLIFSWPGLAALVIFAAALWWKWKAAKRFLAATCALIKRHLTGFLLICLSIGLIVLPLALSGCGQGGGSFSGTAHIPVPDQVRLIPNVGGPYSGAILIDNAVLNGVDPDYRIDEVDLTVNTLYAGGGFAASFGLGLDCASPIAFPPLLLSAGRQAAITDRASLDLLLQLLQGPAFYACVDITNAVDSDLLLTVKGSIAKPVQ